MKVIAKQVMAVVGFALFCAGSAMGQSYPARSVRVLVGYPAGGSLDIVARVLSQQLSEAMGQAFIVDNRPGAGGNLASEALAKADPDGYTIMNGATPTVANLSLYNKVAYKLDDFVPISLVGEAPLLLMANAALPANNIVDVIKLAKSKPGMLKYASAGNGSTSHLASELFRMMAEIELVHIPYKGGGQAFQDVIGGQVELTVLPISESIENVRAKRIKALGQTGAKRSFIAPEIPTLDESGLKGYAVSTWYTIFAPAKVSRDIVNRLYAEIDRALKQPNIQQKLNVAGVDIIGTNPEQTAAFIKNEYQKWAKVIQGAGLKVE